MYAYFIRPVKGGPIKIGKSGQPDQRLASLGRDNPQDLVILAVCGGGWSAERVLHKHFNSERIKGEWFEASPRLLSFIDRLPTWEDVQRGVFCPEIVDPERETIFQLFILGYSYQDIADVWGRTKQRIGALIRQRYPKYYYFKNGYPVYVDTTDWRPDRPSEPVQDAYNRLMLEHSGIEITLPE